MGEMLFQHLLLIFSVFHVVFSTLPTIRHNVLQDLVVKGMSEEIRLALKDQGGKISAFAITGLGDDVEYPEAVKRLRGDAFHNCFEEFGDRFLSMDLDDGTLRRTLADEGQRQYPECAKASLGTIADVFDNMDVLVSNAIERVVKHPLQFTVPGIKDPIRLHGAPHKSHIHEYYRENVNENSGIEWMVPYHVDKGIFLMITPTKVRGLKVKMSDGSVEDTSSLPLDSILVLPGLGLTEWLLQNEEKESEFRPTPHAVPTLTGASRRTVFARMKVAPGQAVPVDPVTKRETTEVEGKEFTAKTFDEVFKKSSDMVTSGQSQVCSVHLDSWGKQMDQQCQEGEAYCWMTCLPLDDNCNSDSNVCVGSDGHVCTDDDMDGTCEWRCTTCLVSGDGHESGSDGVEEKFCSGGMDMLMTGFEVSGDDSTQCVILFIGPWLLNSQVKFIVACCGVFILGMFIEFLIFLRRKISKNKISFRCVHRRLRRTLQRVLLITLFGINLVLGYLAMLVAMTYSVELFLCVCGGIITGHGLFNSKSPVGETIDPCCAASQNNPSTALENQDERPNPTYDPIFHMPVQIETDEGLEMTEKGSVIANGSCCMEKKSDP